MKQQQSEAMPYAGSFGVGVVWLRLLTRHWLGVLVMLTALIAGAIVFILLR